MHTHTCTITTDFNLIFKVRVMDKIISSRKMQAKLCRHKHKMDIKDNKMSSMSDITMHMHILKKRKGLFVCYHDYIHHNDVT